MRALLARASTTRRFGRRAVALAANAPAEAVVGPTMSDDIRLFATWFLGGFAFMWVYLG